jgi:broad-specificity NMP kinase
MHIAIAGNIGSGKTTLTSLLAKHYKWHAHYEDADDNPYLNDFNEDMQRWSFNIRSWRSGRENIPSFRTVLFTKMLTYSLRIYTQWV